MGGFVRSGYPGSDLKASHSLTHHTHSMEHSYEAVSAAGASELRGSRWSGERWSEAALPSCIAATTSDIVRQFSMPSVGTFGHPTETQLLSNGFCRVYTHSRAQPGESNLDVFKRWKGFVACYSLIRRR